MKHMRRLVPPTRTLRQILLTPLPAFRPQFFQLSLRINEVPSRSYSPTSPLLKFRTRATPRALPQYVLDEEIGAQYVQIVNENNSLDPPVSLRDALRQIDRSSQTLQQVSTGSGDGVPICKVVNKFELREIAKAKAKPAKDGLKQLELNWAIDAHDLSHRLKQLTNFLEKGRKVELILTRKKHKRSPTVEEVKNLMDKVMETVREAKAMPVRPMEGEPGKHVVLVVKKDV
ncbi:hypothetical protein AnigIFM60653_002223 [Aspergillus niger]|uniref:Translation initiation factor IF-3, C-terminal domain-domain-containing protein n=3 Tax=Aspergillus TaxID=5052 RepID=A0A3F3QHY0_9EURO|nr:hypothetical protein BDQ94DRAFT_134489 [Aspergillus welwitschiae]RDK47962.1 hypothetical protein M752DRAFT_8187 [Aspergillus phoenicis ATCC 13157]GKZ69854.1 hypothetical protein AnigIFM50267_005084 [Aspergillus niger]RDH38725.1 hypothetical protein BDQ94DRAFT_134489 [Aspergillus welwitschiae]GLA02698.1 hypothetical protein AnigIFM60653_002223 [Aspergillus niger]GLA26122.1 hypothetical protein AnigIFM63326_002928 [Aspergillus niger]